MSCMEMVAEFLRTLPDVRVGIVFGSVATARARFDSDLDVAVAADKILTADQKKAWIEVLALRSGRPVDLVDLRTAGQPLLTQVLTKGTLVHCQDRQLYAELIKRMMFDQADFVPYQQRMLAERRRAWIGS